MTQIYKTIKRNYVVRNGKPHNKKHTTVRRSLYHTIEKNQDISIATHLKLFEEFGVTIELNDGVYCG